MEPLPLSRRYSEEEWLSRRVAVALDRLTGQRVVVKLCPPDDAEDLAREFELLASLEHPNLPRALDFGQLSDGRHFLVMERAAGTKPRGPLSAADLRTLVEGTCEALSLLHSRGIVHRDVKPDNVRLDETSGRVMLLDLGLAAEVGTPGDVSGTLGFIAPEVLAHAPADPRGDLYSLGALLHEAATGAAPFAGTDAQVLRAQKDGRFEPVAARRPDLPAAFGRELAWLLDPEPTRRPSDARDVAQRLLAALGGEDARPQVLLAPGLAGRERERAALLDAASIAKTRTVRIALRGPSGSGRTRLLRWLRDRLVAEGAPVLLRSARPADTHPLSGLARDLSLLLDADVGAGSATGAVARAVAAVHHASLACQASPCRRGPVVIMLDDLHLADADVRREVEAFWHALDGPSVLLVTAHDPAELSWPAPGEAVVELPPLGEADVRALLTAALRGTPPDTLTAAAVAGARTPRALLDQVRGELDAGRLTHAGSWRHSTAPARPSTPPALVGVERTLAAALTVLERAAQVAELAALTELTPREVLSCALRLRELELASLDAGLVAPSSRLLGSASIFAPEELRVLHDKVAAHLDNLSLRTLLSGGEDLRARVLRHRALGTDARQALAAAAELAETRLAEGDLAVARRLAQCGLERATAAEDGEEAGGPEGAVEEARLQAVLARADEREGRLTSALSRRMAQADASRRSGRRPLNVRAAHALGRALLRCGDVAGAERTLEGALALLGAADDGIGRGSEETATTRATVLVDLAEVDRRTGRLEAAAGRLREAEFLCGRSGDTAGEARVVVARGRIACALGNHGGAREAFRDAIGRFERAGDAEAAAAALGDLGRLQLRAGERGAAANSLRTALNIVEKLGNRRAVAEVLLDLAACAAAGGAPAEAIAHLRQAVHAFRHVGDVAGQVAAGNDLAWQLLVAGEVPAALGAGREVLKLLRWTEDRGSAATAFARLAIASCAAASHADALDHGERALAEATASGDPRHESAACWALGRTYSAFGATRDGMKWLRRGIEAARRTGDGLDEGRVGCDIGLLLQREGHLQAACDALQGAIEAASSGGSRGVAALARARWGAAKALAGDLGAGEKLLRDGLSEARACGDRLAELEAQRLLGTHCVDVGDVETGVALLEGALHLATSCGDVQELPALHEAMARACLRRALRLKTSSGAVVERADLQRASRHVETGLELTVSSGRTADRAALRVLGAQVQLLEGKWKQALDQADDAHHLAMDAGDLVVACRARLVAAEALLHAREFGRALGEARTACEAATRMGLPDDAWRAHSLVGRIQGAWGIAERELEEAEAAERILRGLARTIPEARRARAYLLDVERRAAMSPSSSRGSARLRRAAPSALAAERFTGQADADDLVEAAVLTRRRAETLEERAAVSRTNLRQAGSRRRLVEDFLHAVRTAPMTWTRIEALLPAVVRGLGADRTFVLEATATDLRVRASAGHDGRAVDLADFSVSLGIVRAVLASGRPTVASDAQRDRRFGDMPSVRALELRSLACVPLLWQGEVRGVLYVDNALAEGAFRPRDLRTLRAVADALGMALDLEAARAQQAESARAEEVVVGALE